MISRLLLAALPLALAACGGEPQPANIVSEDPFGATGAPGSDMTDKGVNDGASGPADDLAGNNAAAPPP